MAEATSWVDRDDDYDKAFDKCVNRYDAFFLRSVRCALWQLAEQLPEKHVVFTIGALNALGIDHESDHELLRCWTTGLTDEWGFYPYRVESYVFKPYPEHDEYVRPCVKIVFALTEKLSKHFVSRGCSQYDFTAIVDIGDEDDGICLPQNLLGHIFAATFERKTVYEQLSLSDLLNVYDALQKELLFQLMKYGHVSFELFD